MAGARASQGAAGADRRGAPDAGALGAADQDRPGAGVALARSCWPAPRGRPTRRWPSGWGSGRRRWPSGGPVRAPPAGGPDRRAAARSAPHDRRRAGRAGDRQDVGGAAAQARHALVDPVDGHPATGLTQTAMSRIWRAFGLKPHLVDLEAVHRPAVHRQGPRHRRAVPGPARAALVLCVDEKSQIQALDRTAPSLPILPSTPARRTHDYLRTAPPACSPRWTWPPAR